MPEDNSFCHDCGAFLPGMIETHSNKCPASEIKHLSTGECPACGAPGKFDIDSPKGTVLPQGTNWIWYNDELGWECGECWLK